MTSDSGEEMSDDVHIVFIVVDGVGWVAGLFVNGR